MYSERVFPPREQQHELLQFVRVADHLPTTARREAFIRHHRQTLIFFIRLRLRSVLRNVIAEHVLARVLESGRRIPTRGGLRVHGE